MANIDYAIGQAVAVPWGLDVIEGVVVGSYGEGRGRRILVDVPVSGEGEPAETLPFPVHVLDAARGSVHEQSAGSWFSAYHYELTLQAALGRALGATKTEEYPRHLLSHGVDAGYDIEYSIDDVRILIEAKHYSNPNSAVRKESFFQLKKMVEKEQAKGQRVAGLLVTSANIPENLEKMVIDFQNQGFPIWALRWHPEEGPKPLIKPLQVAIRSAK